MSEIKISVDKLESPSEWPKWKWQMGMLFRQYDLKGIITGEIVCPTINENSSAEEKKKQKDWLKEDAKASGLIATSLSSPIAELVLTCETSKEIWDKLSARFERSSIQRLNMLIDSFFQAKKIEDEDISAHIAKLQKLFVDLNAELSKHKENTLSERILNGRIISTLGKEFDHFRDLWDTIPAEKQTLNLLIEKLCAIETREIKQNTINSNENSALVTNIKKKQQNSDKLKLDRAKQKFPCNKCKQFGHWAAECPQNKIVKKNNVRKFNALIAYSLNATNENLLNANHWYCDSGASRHITPNKCQFESYVRFDEPEVICVGKQDVTMKAYGKGNIRIQTKVENFWEEALLQEVWYVPEASAQLFSVKAAARNGFITTLNDKTVTIKNKDDEVVIVGYLLNELYVLKIQVIKPKVQVLVSKTQETLQVYHERFAHQNKRHVKKILGKLNVNVPQGDEEFCDGCMIGKMHRLPFKSKSERPSKIGEIIHADVFGPVETPSLGGARYYVCFIDDYSKFRKIFFLKHKSEVCKCLETFLNEAKSNGHIVKKFRSDGGKEFDNKEVSNVLSKFGVEQWITPPHTPQQNGIAERENRTIVEAARSMRVSSKLPKYLWAEACNTAVYVLNRTGPTNVEDKVPYELWFEKQIKNLSHLRIFGTTCYVHIPKERRKKFDDKAVFGRMVGYVNEKDGYRVWIPKMNKIVNSHDVIFKKEVVCNLNDNISEDNEDFRKEKEKVEFVVIQDNGNDKESVTRINEELENTASLTVENEVETQETVDEAESSKSNSQNKETESRSENEELAINKRERKKPAWMTGGWFAMLAEEEAAKSNHEPRTYNEAIKSSNSEKWITAMKEELSSLEENRTWELVKRPSNPVVKNRWVFKIKDSVPGEKPRFKARLVAKGYVQQKGIDYDETFSPVARYDTVRMLLALAATQKLKIKQFDVKTAFLYGTLEEEVYLEQPEGFEDGTGRVCRLKGSLYGLKQAPRCWHKRFINFMSKTGLNNSKADPCLFYRNEKGSVLYVAIYVDDGLVFGNNEEEIQNFMQELKKEFKITIGTLDNFLGMKIKIANDGSIQLSQEKYIERILERFNMKESNSVTTPIVREEEKLKFEELKEEIPYREAVGSLMYLATGTRPDIAFAVNSAARKMEKPTKEDWNNVKRIFRYIRGTSKLVIKYKSNNKRELQIYSDADYAGDFKTRRSTTGVISMFAGGPISWTSQLQKTVALSTTEAEIMAATDGAKEAMWLKRLQDELMGRNDIKPLLLIDNASAIKLAKNPEYHKRSKHIQVRYFYVRERFLEGDINLEHIPGTNQLADLLTKPLERVRFQMLRNKIGID